MSKRKKQHRVIEVLKACRSIRTIHAIDESWTIDDIKAVVYSQGSYARTTTLAEWVKDGPHASADFTIGDIQFEFKTAAYPQRVRQLIEKTMKEAGLEEANTDPPKSGEMALWMVLGREELEYVTGDMAELYAEASSKFSARFARVWYWWHVVRSAISFLSGKLIASIIAEVAKKLRG